MYLVSTVISNDRDWTYSEPRLFEKKEDAHKYFSNEVLEYIGNNTKSKTELEDIKESISLIQERDCSDIIYKTINWIFDWDVTFTHEWSSLYFWNEESNWAVTFEFHILKQDAN